MRHQLARWLRLTAMIMDGSIWPCIEQPQTIITRTEPPQAELNRMLQQWTVKHGGMAAKR